MNTLLRLIIGLAVISVAQAGDKEFSANMRTRLVFRAGHDAYYAHVLKVYLRIENTRDSSLTWVAGQVTGIEAELIGPDGKPVPEPPQARSVGLNKEVFRLSYGSNLEWLISHGGVTVSGDSAKNYVLVLGRHAWLVPIADVNSYLLRVRFKGFPWADRTEMCRDEDAVSIADFPPTKITIEIEAEQAGAGQPATRPVVEPEGGDKPQPEAEGRSR